jgi:hypothetical protein
MHSAESASRPASPPFQCDKRAFARVLVSPGIGDLQVRRREGLRAAFRIARVRTPARVSEILAGPPV